MQQRCTNCGAVARPGARFCTSCGTRLNQEQPSASSWEQPARNEETLVATPAVTAEREGPGTEEPTAATDTDAAGSVVNETPEQAESGTERAMETSFTSPPSWRWDAGTSQSQQPEETTAPEEPAPAPTWSTRWPTLGGTEGAEEAEKRGPSDQPTEGQERESGGTTAADAAAVWSWERQTSDQGATSPEELGGSENLTTVDSTALMDTAETGTGQATSAESPSQRAAALLDELRALLPQIAAGDTAGEDPTALARSVADALAAARGEAGDFSSLRRPLEAAQQNPRDVDAMLDLVNRADRLLALLDSHERLARAVDDAAARLRAG